MTAASRPISRRSEAQTHRSGASLDALKYWMILVPLGAGVLLAWRSHAVLPKKLFLDEAILLRFVSGELRADGWSSYGTTGWLYKTTGLGAIPGFFPVLAYLVFAATVLAALTWRGIPRLSFLVIGLAAGSLLLGAVFLSQYSKEFFVIPLAALLLLARRSVAIEVAWVALALLYATFLRPYWFLVVACFLALRFLMPRMRSPWLLVPVIMIGFAAMIIVFDLVFDAPLTFFRIDINNALDFDRSTQIDDLISGESFVAQWLNAGIMLIALAFPVSLLTSGEPIQLLAGGFMAVCWALVLVRIRRATGTSGPALLPLAFLLSFLMVQTVFEPDFGSYLRHITPQLPLFLALFVATARRPDVRRGPVLPPDRGPRLRSRVARPVSAPRRGLRRPTRTAN